MDFVLAPDPRLDVIGELLEACPSFAPVLGEHLERSGEPRLDYAEVGELASHLVGLYEHGALHELPAGYRQRQRRPGSRPTRIPTDAGCGWT
jgi:hypothetical protein